MRRIVIFVLFLFLLLSYSCVETETIHEYQLVNNTQHDIDIFYYYNGKAFDSLFLLPNEDQIYSSFYDGETNHLNPLFGDSVKVIFSDTVAIIHGSMNYDVQRSILDHRFYDSGNKQGPKNHAYFYNYHYLLTEADYQEALTLR